MRAESDILLTAQKGKTENGLSKLQQGRKISEVIESASFDNDGTTNLWRFFKTMFLTFYERK